MLFIFSFKSYWTERQHHLVHYYVLILLYVSRFENESLVYNKFTYSSQQPAIRKTAADMITGHDKYKTGKFSFTKRKPT